jgi:hypothetical protein
MLAHTIDEVIAQLDDIIARARREDSRLGFFAALYRQVTIKVKEGIGSGRFEDGNRMERLDVIFANRYLEALHHFRQGEQLSECWLVAFEADKSWRLLILQHLLLGINAHINLDLGIAAAQTSPGEKLPTLKRDFEEINNILGELLDAVQEKLGMVSPWLGLLDHVAGRTDEVIVNFSLQRARKAAWKTAEKLASLSPEQQVSEIDELDRHIEGLANRIRKPGWFLSLVALIIRLAESNNIPRIIDILTVTP